MRPFEAALKGAGQIGFTIISITFSLIAVFIPLLFMGGIIGRLFREFAVTVSVAVIASALISLTLTPVMCSLFLKGQRRAPAGPLQPRCRARASRRCCAPTTAGSASSSATSSSALMATLAADGRDRLPLREDPERLFPAAGHRLHLRPGAMRARTPRSQDGRDRPRGRRYRAQGSRRRGRLLFRRRHAYNPTENTGARSSSS